MGKEVIYSEPKELQWKVTYSGQDHSTELKDLHPATEYQFRVSAINSSGASPSSPAVTMLTPASVPASPHGLHLWNCSSSHLTLRWNKPVDNGEVITNYNVELGQKDKEFALLNVNRKRVTLSDLKPDT